MEAERQAYLNTIERTFVTLRGRGFMLSAKEVTLVDRWFEQGVPARVVVRALQEGFERRARRRQPAPGSLTYFEGPVETAIDAWRQRHPSAGQVEVAEEASPGDQLRAALDRLIADAEHPGVVPVLESVRGAIADLDDAEGVWSLTTRLDGMIVRALTETLDAEERSSLDDQARETIGSNRAVSERARAGLEAAEFERLLRAHFQIASLREFLD